VIRVCHLIKGLGRGGAESLLPLLARHRGPGVEYSVGYFVPRKDALVAELAALGLPVRCFAAATPAAMMARVRAVAAWLRSERADLLHCHLPLAAVVGRLAARLERVPVVYTEHNVLERYHPWTRWANELTWRLQRQVVAVSEEVARSARRNAGSAVPVRVVLNGIDVEGLQVEPGEAEVVRAELGIPREAPVVATVAVFRAQKRLDHWLAAAERVARARPEARFLLVGDGALRGTIEAQAGRLQCARSVHFTGLRQRVAPYLAASDVFFSSSDFEGLPLAVLEAMALARPIVATAVGGVPEVVTGECGSLVSPGDVDGMAAALESVLADPARARRMGEAGRQRVSELFGIGRMARQIEALYQEVAHRES
jgi:glycosyltransferase involved in cell wall biosynthesis